MAIITGWPFASTIGVPLASILGRAQPAFNARPLQARELTLPPFEEVVVGAHEVGQVVV